jgi:hypothetical protein
MKHEIIHNLGQAKAREIADKALGAYQAKFAEYEPKVNWKTEKSADISFNVKGMKLSGAIEINDKAFDVELDVPFILRPFKGKALEVIESEMRKWISRETA